MEQSRFKKADCLEECASCGILAAYECIVLKKCSKSKHVLYCGKEWQLLNWNKGGHKGFCVPRKDTNPQLYGRDEVVMNVQPCLICQESV